MHGQWIKQASRLTVKHCPCETKSGEDFTVMAALALPTAKV